MAEDVRAGFRRSDPWVSANTHSPKGTSPARCGHSLTSLMPYQKLHNMLERFAKDIWVVEGSVVSIAGFDYSTRMAIIRLSTNGLFVWSPTGLLPELKSQVDALGTVQFVVAPNPVHHLFIGEWAESYPEALLFGPPGLRKKRPDIGWHGALKDAPEPGWSADIDQVVVRGNLLGFETVFFHRASGTALFTRFDPALRPRVVQRMASFHRQAGLDDCA